MVLVLKICEVSVWLSASNSSRTSTFLRCFTLLVDLLVLVFICVVWVSVIFKWWMVCLFLLVIWCWISCLVVKFIRVKISSAVRKLWCRMVCFICKCLMIKRVFGLFWSGCCIFWLCLSCKCLCFVCLIWLIVILNLCRRRRRTIFVICLRVCSRMVFLLRVFLMWICGLRCCLIGVSLLLLVECVLVVFCVVLLLLKFVWWSNVFSSISLIRNRVKRFWFKLVKCGFLIVFIRLWLLLEILIMLKICFFLFLLIGVVLVVVFGICMERFWSSVRWLSMNFECIVIWCSFIFCWMVSFGVVFGLLLIWLLMKWEWRCMWIRNFEVVFLNC